MGEEGTIFHLEEFHTFSDTGSTYSQNSGLIGGVFYFIGNDASVTSSVAFTSISFSDNFASSGAVFAIYEKVNI